MHFPALEISSPRPAASSVNLPACATQVPNQHITAVAMIPDIDRGLISVTVNGSESAEAASNLTAQVQVLSRGQEVGLICRLRLEAALLS